MKAAAISSKAISHLHIAPRLGGGRSIGSAKLVFDGGESLTYHLTPRELEVLSLLCEGLPNKLIARRLNIAPGTVKIHVMQILRTLNVSSRLQAVVSVRGLGIEFKSVGAEPMPRDTVAALRAAAASRLTPAEEDKPRLRAVGSGRSLAAA